ncbi:MAG TPA: ATP-binding protein [Gemmataceae bacterium]|nr:ATP-binding protein [Gemmataceae bacterium]
MPFGPLERRLHTLRFRLTFWNTAAIILVVLATLFGLREGLRWTLLREMDTLLSEDVQEVRLVLERFYPDAEQVRDELERKARSHSQRGWYVRIFSADGAVLLASTGAPDVELPALRPVPKQPFIVADYRLVQRTVRLAGAGRPELVVRVGSSLAEIDDDVLRLTEMILVAAAVIVVVAPLSGYFLAGRATRPLDTILRTTARLRPDRLVERLPLRGSGDELDRLSATINGLLDRLADHLARQRDFVANAAHELRSPLAAMRTSLEVALEHDRTPEEYRELLADVVEECAGLGKLVNRLLLLAEGDAGLLQASGGSARLDRLAARAADMFRGTAEQRGVELDVKAPEPAPVLGNDAHLRQVVHNLIDNALKFTPAGGRVTVEVGRRGGQAMLRVSDTGAGIAPEDLPHVFERFYRADKARSRELPGGGTGLGLSICHAVVTAYGGHIGVESKLGQGTAVTAVLPLAADVPANLAKV